MVHDHPVLALFHECEAITRWQRLGFAVLDIRERVVAGVDSGAAINADQLLAECDLETGQDLEGRDEVVPQRCSQGRRESAPENSISGIEKNNFVRIVLSQSPGPFHGRGGDVFLRPGRSDRCSYEQATSEYEQRSRSQSPESPASFSSSIKKRHNIQSCRHGPGRAECRDDRTPTVNPAQVALYP